MGAAATAPTMAALPMQGMNSTYNPANMPAFQSNVSKPSALPSNSTGIIPQVAGPEFEERQVMAPQVDVPQFTSSPVAANSGFNINQASADALKGAIGGTQEAMRNPLQVGAFMNPYTSEVIDRTQQDIERQRQLASQQLGARATAAKAFGGSRQGVAEGVLAGEFGRMGADIAAQQRASGYNQALDAAMRDRAARAGFAGQLGGLGGQAFGISRDINQQQIQQGLMQQMLQQQLIDAAKAQYAGYTGSPMASLTAPLAALGVVPNQSTTTQSRQLGLFDYLKLPFMAAGMGR